MSGDTSYLSAGVNQDRITAANFVEMRKMLLMKLKRLFKSGTLESLLKRGLSC